MLTTGNNINSNTYIKSKVKQEILAFAKSVLNGLKREKYLMDSLLYQKKEVMSRYNGSKRMIADSIKQVSNEFSRIVSNSGNTAEMLAEKNLVNGHDKIAGLLNKFEQIQIGRSEVNYSRLTVYNWPITGLNVTTSGRHKFEVAAGISNYRQRNFLIPVQNGKITGQPTLSGRYKIFAKPTLSLSYTAYMGSMLLNYQAVLNPKTIPVLGNGLQLSLLPFKNQKIDVEFVKSNVNELRVLPDAGVKMKGQLFNFGIRDNEAIRIQYNGVFRVLKGNLDGEYTRSGSSFLSLGFYPGEAVRETFHANLLKRFFENKMNVRLGVRKNSFSYPYLQHLTANNVLYQALVTLRLKKWPVVTMGYFPSTQLVAMPDSNIAEINFQTFITTASYQIVKPLFTHSFLLSGSFLQTKMNETFSAPAMMNNFLGFNYNGYHGKKWRFEGMLMYNNLKGRSLLTYGVGSGLKEGKGWEQSFILKYHSGNSDNSQWGYKIMLRSKMFKFGQIMLEGERQMLPYFSQAKFVPVMMGHAVFMMKF